MDQTMQGKNGRERTNEARPVDWQADGLPPLGRVDADDIQSMAAASIPQEDRSYEPDRSVGRVRLPTSIPKRKRKVAPPPPVHCKERTVDKRSQEHPKSPRELGYYSVLDLPGLAGTLLERVAEARLPGRWIKFSRKIDHSG